MLLFIFSIFSMASSSDVISIHLMLLFIITLLMSLSFVTLFQYISCYCLSSSHSSSSSGSFIFQYISCYCLSSYPVNFFIVNISFQYISCYCLSLRLCLCSFFLCISIHLMLLFISIWNTPSVFPFHFNTSHVTVYPVS